MGPGSALQSGMERVITVIRVIRVCKRYESLGFIGIG